MNTSSVQRPKFSSFEASLSIVNTTLTVSKYDPLYQRLLRYDPTSILTFLRYDTTNILTFSDLIHTFSKYEQKQ